MSRADSTALPVHYEVEVLYGTLYQPLCENNARRDALRGLSREVEMTIDDAQVTCGKCLTALGYEVSALTDIERLEPRDGYERVAA